jgi:hypothetical protein
VEDTEGNKLYHGSKFYWWWTLKKTSYTMAVSFIGGGH